MAAGTTTVLARDSWHRTRRNTAWGADYGASCVSEVLACARTLLVARRQDKLLFAKSTVLWPPTRRQVSAYWIVPRFSATTLP